MHETVRPRAPHVVEDLGRQPAADLEFVVGLLKARAGLLALSLLIGLAGAGYYLLTASPSYISSAKLLIQAPRGPGNSPFSEAGSVVDTAQVESQVEILRAAVIAEDVVRRLNLVADPEFAPPPPGEYPFGSLLARSDSAASWFPRVQAVVQQAEAWLRRDQAARSPDETFRTAVSSFGDRISVRRLGQSDVIEIDFSSSSPTKAARIVKETVDAYFRGAWREDTSPNAFHRFNESVMRSSLAVNNARLISAPLPPLGKSSPKTSLIIAFAAAVSLFFGFSLALWLEARRSARMRIAKVAFEAAGAYEAASAREGPRVEAVQYAFKDASR